jgi:thiol-disulfide isomerase/thioredoxin
MRPRLLAGIAVVLAAAGVAFVAEAVLSSDVPDGTSLSELTFDRFDGGTGTLADYEGTPLVVNFFASWCPPCVREMPDFQEVFEDLDGQVAFLGLSQDQSTQAALNLVETTGVTYDVGWDPDLEVYEATGSIAMPTTALVSPSGELVDTFAGALDAASLAEFIEDELGIAARP